MTDAYAEFVSAVDRMTERISAKYGRHLCCRAGCAGCCDQHFSVFAVEAAGIAEAVRLLPEEMGIRVGRNAEAVLSGLASVPSCPLLIEEKCSVYQARPVLCRTQGLPLLLRAGDGSYEVDFCPLNFTGPDATEDLEEGYLVDLETLNRNLVLINLAYCRARGKTARESGERIPIGAAILQGQGRTE